MSRFLSNTLSTLLALNMIRMLGKVYKLKSNHSSLKFYMLKYFPSLLLNRCSLVWDSADPCQLKTCLHTVCQQKERKVGKGVSCEEQKWTPKRCVSYIFYAWFKLICLRSLPWHGYHFKCSGCKLNDPQHKIPISVPCSCLKRKCWEISIRSWFQFNLWISFDVVISTELCSLKVPQNKYFRCDLAKPCEPLCLGKVVLPKMSQ